jgi:hypothetical protein
MKGSDEKYCHACGGVIRARAELCPKCGVRQPAEESEGDRRFEYQPHRGTGILVLGVASLFVCPLPLGLVAWIWANQDLRKMKAGVMDPEGLGSTQAGKVCGMNSSLLFLTFLGLFCCVGLFSIGGPLALFSLGAALNTDRNGWHAQDRDEWHAAPSTQRTPDPVRSRNAGTQPSFDRNEQDEARKRKLREELEAREKASRDEALRKAREDAEKKAKAAAAKQAAKDEATAREHFRYAKKLLEQGMNDLAKERLKKIVTEWPNTNAAKDAKELLAKLSA